MKKIIKPISYEQFVEFARDFKARLESETLRSSMGYTINQSIVMAIVNLSIKLKFKEIREKGFAVMTLISDKSSYINKYERDLVIAYTEDFYKQLYSVYYEKIDDNYTKEAILLKYFVQDIIFDYME